MTQTNPGKLFHVFRWLVFKIGDLRWLGWRTFPCFTFDVHRHQIDLNEVILEALPRLQPGDVILHRDKGYPANRLIGKGMIHAGLCVENNQVVEAISEGVVKRHAAHILYSDYACILRPRFDRSGAMEPEKWSPRDQAQAKLKAVCWAQAIIGFPYDVLFNFNAWEEREAIAAHGKEGRKMGVRFCCTEIPYFCYLDYVQHLRMFRKRNISLATRILSWLGLNPGKVIIDADMYLTANFDLVWCSREATTEWAAKSGLSEEAVFKIRKWWAGR